MYEEIRAWRAYWGSSVTHPSHRTKTRTTNTATKLNASLAIARRFAKMIQTHMSCGLISSFDQRKHPVKVIHEVAHFT